MIRVPSSLLKRLQLRRSATLFQNLVGSAASTLTGVVWGIITARVLGVDGRGALAAFVVWVAFIAAGVNAGLPHALVFHIAKGELSERSIWRATKTILVVQGIVVILLCVLLERIPSIAFKYGFAIVTVAITSLFGSCINAVLQGRGDFRRLMFSRMIFASGHLLGIVLAWAIHLLTIDAVVKMVALGNIVTCLAMWILLPAGPVSNKRIANIETIGSLLRYGWKVYLGNISWFTNARVDQLIISALLSRSNLGIYAVAVSYGMLLFPIAGAFSVSVFQETASGSGWRSGLRYLLSFVAIGGLATIAISVIASPVIVWVFGKDFAGSGNVAPIVAAGIFVMGVNLILSDLLRGLGYPLVPSLSEFVGTIITISGVSLAARYGSLRTVAFASLLGYLSVLAALVIGLKLVTRSGGNR